MDRIRSALCILALALTIRCAAAAEVAYDPKETLILDGAIKSVDWSGTRLSLVFHSNNGYDGADWTLEGPDTAQLRSMGWMRDEIKAGDRMDAVVRPATDGSTRGALLRFLLPDGQTLETSRHGTTLVIPRDQLNRTYANLADDPMGGHYGNTEVFYASDPEGPVEANYSGRVWFNPDHTLVMTSTDLSADRKTWSGRIMKGTWWYEKQADRWVQCNWFQPSPIPYCHSPVDSKQLGDKWSIVFHGAKADWTEHREVVAGQR